MPSGGAPPEAGRPPEVPAQAGHLVEEEVEEIEKAAQGGALPIASETKEGSPARDGGDTQPHEAWHLQMMDFEIGWGHRLLGLSDHVNLVSGLVYGAVIVFLCTCMLFYIGLRASSGETGGAFPHVARWFVFFLNLQMFLYVLLVFTKMPKLCYIQKHYYPALDYDCTFLRYLQLEHGVTVISLFSFAIWTFSSYAYVLTFGDSSKADKPDFTHQLETMLNMDDVHAAERRMGLEAYSQNAERRIFSRLAGTERYLRAGLPAGSAPAAAASAAPGLVGPAYRAPGSAPSTARPSVAARPSLAASSLYPALR